MKSCWFNDVLLRLGQGQPVCGISQMESDLIWLIGDSFMTELSHDRSQRYHMVDNDSVICVSTLKECLNLHENDWRQIC